MRTIVLLLAFVMSSAAHAGFRAYDSSDAALGFAHKVKCSTGLTCTLTSGKLSIVSTPTITGSLTLESAEVLANDTDDVVEVRSNDEHTTFQVTGFEAKNAILNLYPDQGDDNADKYSIKADTSDVLSFNNNGTAFLQFSSAGVMTLSDSETLTNTGDSLTLGADDSGARMNLLGFEASNAALYLQTDESDDNGDDWAITAAASDNSLTFSNDTSGSHVAKLVLTTGGAMSGYKQLQTASTTASLTFTACGSTIVSDSADVMTLPEASTVLGCRITFVCGTADDLDVNPADGTDTILPTGALTPSAGDAIRCTDAGAGFELEAVGVNSWAVLHTNLTITDVN